jgi:flagellar biosynthesis/type III secretory pathway M-ring protein FliF/YscJ
MKNFIEVRKNTKESYMNKGFKQLTPIIGAIVAMSLLLGEDGSYLSQKLMVENNIRTRVQDALSKIIDSHKYVINVDIELDIMDEVNEQITILAPRESSTPVIVSPGEETANALIEIQKKMMDENKASSGGQYSIGLPIPGFEIDVTDEKPVAVAKPSPQPISPETMEPVVQASIDDSSKEYVDKVLSRKRPSRAEVKRIDLTLILQEGAGPELMENIRTLTMAAAGINRGRGDKFTIMTASFKERRDQRSAEQIMLKNIAEKIDLLEQKRLSESTDWRDQINKYRDEESSRREEDRSFFETQLSQMEEKAKAQAYSAEKKEMLRRDSMKVAKLNNEIQALKDMLTMSMEDDGSDKQAKIDSSRFAMLDNEFQALRKMLLQAMLQDSVESQKDAQSQIVSKLAEREKEKATRDSLIEQKIAMLDAVQADLDALQVEMSSGMDSSQLLLIILAVLSALLLFALVFVMGRSKQQAPAPPWMYPPLRSKKKKKKSKKKSKSSKFDDEAQVEAPVQTVTSAPQATTPAMDIGEDPNVLRSEIDDIRKSVVSMSVGQPDKTSTIVKEWLEQPAPAPMEPEADSSSGDGDDDDEE